MIWLNVPVGRMTLKLYPKNTPVMPVHERASFQVNKATLKDLPTNLRLVIDAFGAQLNGHCPPVPRQSHPAQTIPDDANNIIIRLPVEATQLQRKHVCATWVQGQGPSCPNDP